MSYLLGTGAVPAMISAETPCVALVSSATHLAGSNYASATWPAADAAHFYPILIPFACVVRRVWWANGATVSASYNIDCGIYADAGYKPGAKIVSSGSTAQGTAANVQFADVTDTALAPGLYWLALVCSSASATIQRISTNTNADAAFKFVQTSALPLPATASPVESTSRTIQLFGFATTASP